MTQGRLLEKQFTKNDPNYTTGLDMGIIYTDKIQHGQSGTHEAFEANYEISGGAGGSGGTTSIATGGRGIGGKRRIETRVNKLTDEVIWRVGTGGPVGGKYDVSGGTTGSSGSTGGGSSQLNTMSSEGYSIHLLSGGGGGGYSQILTRRDEADLPGYDIIAAGGGGGTGAIEFGSCPNTYVNPGNGRHYYNIYLTSLDSDFNNEVLRDFSGNIIGTSSVDNTNNSSVGSTGDQVLPHGGNAEVGSKGAGGGGIPGSVGGWTGAGPGDLLTNLTPANNDGEDGSLTLRFRGYTEDVDECVSLIARPNTLVLPQGLNIDPEEAQVEQLGAAIPKSTKFRVRANYAVDAAGVAISTIPIELQDGGNDAARIDPEAAFFDPTGMVLKSDDDDSTRPGDERYLPSFEFSNGLDSGVYYMVVSRWNTSYSSGFTVSGTQPILNFPLRIDIETKNSTGEWNILSSVNFQPDGQSRHIWCACTII